MGGRKGCEEAWFELGVRAATKAHAVRTRAMHDAWCLQHPEPYTRSLKSFYVHFLGVCVAIDRPSDPRAQSAIWDDIRVPPGIGKPQPPSPAVSLHAGYVVADPNADVGARFVRAEWQRWSHAHGVARAWLTQALESRRRPERPKT